MANYDRTHDAFGDTENSFEFAGKSTFTLEVNQYVVALVLIVDRISELSLAPLICINDFTVVSDKLCELFNKSFRFSF